MPDNVIKFPSERIRETSAFDMEFHERTKDLPPELASCIKSAYARVVKQHGNDLPAFELQISGETDVTIERVESAVTSLMENHKMRVLSMLKCILTLETEICMLITHSGTEPVE